jgi:hypothetical protein
MQGASDAGIELAPGETLVPGSVQTVEPAAGEGEAAAKEGEAAAEEGGEAVESASDAGGEAPPEPKPEADTDV